MSVFFSRASVSAAVIFVLGACSTSDPLGVGGSNTNGNLGTTQAEYDLAVKKWQAAAPPHYRIVVAQTCECTSEFQRPSRVTVRRTGDQAVETIEDVVDAVTLGPVSADRRAAAKSVDGLLVLIQQGLALNPQDVRITYDGTFGYPISINIDPVTSITGDEIVYKVTSFETIP
jgi:Family of unknown function (DUF6174)